MKNKELEVEMNINESKIESSKLNELLALLFRQTHEPAKFYLLGRRDAETGKYFFRWVETMAE